MGDALITCNDVNDCNLQVIVMVAAWVKEGYEGGWGGGKVKQIRVNMRPKWWKWSRLVVVKHVSVDGEKKKKINEKEGERRKRRTLSCSYQTSIIVRKKII